MRAAEMVAEPRRGVERRRSADEGVAVARELELELGVGLGLVPGVLQLLERAHQRLRHILAAERPEAAAHRVAHAVSARRTARMNAAIFCGDFTRTALSTPLETSTP